MSDWHDSKSFNVDLEIRVDKLEGDNSQTYYAVITDAPIPGLGRLHTFDATHLLSASLQLEQQIEKAITSSSNLSDFRSPLYQEMVNMGDLLFAALLPVGSSARDCFAICLRRIISRELGVNKRLRLKLNIHEALHNLPWELLHYKGTDLSGREESFFLAVGYPNTAVVRYMGNTVWRSEQIWRQAPLQLGLLIVVARPIIPGIAEKHQRELIASINREKQSILKALQPLIDTGRISVRIVEGPNTLFELTRAANENLNILHYIGHGDYSPNFGSFLIGEDQESYSAEILSSDLAMSLTHSSNLRLVILNACHLGHEQSNTPFGSVAFRLAQSIGVPAIIAMKYSVRTDTAEIFAREFYSQLVNRHSSVYEAMRFSCAQIQAMNNRVEWATPLLIMSSVNGVFADFPILMPSQTVNAKVNSEQSNNSTISIMDINKSEEKMSPILPSEMVIIQEGESIAGLNEHQTLALIKKIFNGSYNIADNKHNRRFITEQLSKVKWQKVTIPAFYIDKYPVTNAQFEQFVQATSYQTEAERRRENETWRTHYIGADKANHPVICVSWKDASTYARWAGKRLPTVQEWEKAARGKKGNLYPWGDDWDPHRCNNESSMRGYQTTPVNNFDTGKSQFGVYDMVGNVCEWTNTAVDSSYIVLGGSWREACELYGLVAFGRPAASSLASDDLGFRCVKDA